MKKLSPVLLIACCLASPARAAEVAIDTEAVKLVRLFVKTPTPELPPDLVEPFLAVNPAALPKKLRPAFEAKKFELYTLKRIAEGKAKGDYRFAKDDCSEIKEEKSNDMALLKRAGYVEIEEDEEQYLAEKTHCTEQKQMCEFSLQVVVETRGRRIPKRHYFLYPTDPLMALVTEYRMARGHKQTNFFGLGSYPTCAQ